MGVMAYRGLYSSRSGSRSSTTLCCVWHTDHGMVVLCYSCLGVCIGAHQGLPGMRCEGNREMYRCFDCAQEGSNVLSDAGCVVPSSNGSGPTLPSQVVGGKYRH